MAKYDNMRLCGGTYLVLLLEAKKHRRNARMGDGRTSDGLSNPEVFSYLIRTVNKDFQIPSGRSFNTFTSDYKLCRTCDSPSAGLTDKFLVQQFDANIKAAFYKTLQPFFAYLELTVNLEVKGPWLVAALLDLIEGDHTIPDSAEFHVRPYGHPVKKSDLRNIPCICIPSFIFGVWHYIITHIPDNTVGAATIDQLLEKSSERRAERKFISPIGQETVSKIKTSIHPPEYEWENYHAPSMETLTKDIPFAFIAPGVAADVRNIQNGQVFVDSNQVFYLDGQEHHTVPTIISTPFDVYLEKSVAFYSMVKTLLYSEIPHKFRDFYVPNDITLKHPFSLPQSEKSSKPIEVLAIESTGNIIIQGTGGIGKSMMMRHLFLYFAQHFEDNAPLPILAFLKNFKEQVPDLIHFLFHAVQEFDHNLQFKDFEITLQRQGCLILLDGLDEISQAAKLHFYNCLSRFTKEYTNSHIVLSSRPTGSFIQYGHFIVYDIQPFSKEKALELIDKLEYYDKEAKSKFREDLDRRLYDSHRQFASNPLLLTIMLMTYASYGEVPAKRHIFYAKAYETMARLHDASKGAYVRPMHTGLTPEDFSIFFAEFCARTYRDEVLEFDERIFSDYMQKVIRHQRPKFFVTPRQFLLDLTDNLCLMYKEGERYYFIHRSFQEYFCAVFFSTQMDDQLGKIGDFFENQLHRQLGDRTFDMLYDMIPTRIDRYIFLPFLTSLWNRCDAEKGYWTFLEEMYPVFFLQEGDVTQYYENDPQSYLYDFIVNESLHRHNGELDLLEWWPEQIESFQRKEWYRIERTASQQDGKQYVLSLAVEYDELDDEYLSIHGIPQISGVSWQVQIHEILSNPDYYSPLIEFIENDSFPLKKEYNEMRTFTQQLDESINEKSPSDDWFDSF